MPYRHVIWDWNGTLLDDVELCLGIGNAMLARRGLSPLTLEAYRETFDFPVRDYYTRLGFDFAREPFEALAIEFFSAYESRRHEAEAPPERVALLRWLHEAGVRQSVLSAYTQDRLEHVLVERGLRDLFEHVVGQDNHQAHGKAEEGRALIARLRSGGAADPRATAAATAGARSPDPTAAHGEASRDASGLEKRVLEETVLIGDTRHDAEVAEAMGIPCLLVAYGHQSATRLRATGAPVRESVADLAATLSR